MSIVSVEIIHVTPLYNFMSSRRVQHVT